jgi:hypothetical protein
MALQLIFDELANDGKDGVFGTLKNPDTGHEWQACSIYPTVFPQAGGYETIWTDHPIHGLCYEIIVPGHTGVLMHHGNWAGNEADGERSDFKGCLGLGENRGEMTPPGMAKPQEAIESSNKAISEFEKEMNQQSFLLVVTFEWPGASPLSAA